MQMTLCYGTFKGQLFFAERAFELLSSVFAMTHFLPWKYGLSQEITLFYLLLTTSL